MRTDNYLWLVILPLLFASPWIVGSVAFWITRPKGGYLPPSHADLAYRR